MASALQELLGATVVDGSGKTVAVSSLAGNDKVLGTRSHMTYLLRLGLMNDIRNACTIFVICPHRTN